MNAIMDESEIEYARPRRAAQRFGVSTRTLYLWERSGLIASRLVKEPGKKWGMRLFNIASIRRHIEGHE